MTASAHPSCTIVSVTGHSGYTEGCMYAVWKSYLELKGQIADLKCLLISPDKPKKLPDFISWQETVPFSYLEYSIFMLYALHQFIDTDFVLVVQDDGWVVNGDRWDDRFFDYDYIGAPMMQYCLNEPPYLLTALNFYIQHFRKIPQGYIEGQNGGFSLRSRKLLKMPSILELPYQIPPLSLGESVKGTPFSFKFIYEYHHEDLLISVAWRRLLQKQGIVFAPREVAVRFALQDPVVLDCLNMGRKKKDRLSLKDVMGRHFYRGVRLKGLNAVEVPKGLFPDADSLQSSESIQYLLSKGYTVACQGDGFST